MLNAREKGLLNKFHLSVKGGVAQEQAPANSSLYDHTKVRTALKNCGLTDGEFNLRADGEGLRLTVHKTGIEKLGNEGVSLRYLDAPVGPAT